MALHVLGAGFCCPDAEISNSMLRELGSDASIETLERDTGITSRRTTLPEQYLRESGNDNRRLVKTCGAISPTDIGTRAVLQALDRSNITPENISYIIGDCATPVQVIPAESQRIGQQLKLKVSSYDFTATTGPIPAHLDAILNWREECVPEYCVLVASNTPTQHLSYRFGHESFFFGDGAGALVVSGRHAGKLAVRDAEMFHLMEESGAISFDLFGGGIYPRGAGTMVYELARKAAELALSKNGLNAAQIKFIGPQFNARATEELAQSLGVKPENHWSSVSRYGNTLGSAPLITLAEQWDTIKRGDIVVCVQVGVGLSYGYAVFEGVQ